MADITVFPSISTIAPGDESLIFSDAGVFKTFSFAVATKAGQVVVYTSNEGEVTPATGSATERVAGVAIYNVPAGGVGSVAMAGNILRLVNADDTTAIPTGSWVETNDNPVKGTVNAIDFTATGTTAVIHARTVGMAVGPIPANGAGNVLIIPIPITVPNAS